MYVTEDSYLELTKNFQNSESTENPTRKWAKGPFTEHMDGRAAHEETGSTPIREADAASGRGEALLHVCQQSQDKNDGDSPAEISKTRCSRRHGPASVPGLGISGPTGRTAQPKQNKQDTGSEIAHALSGMKTDAATLGTSLSSSLKTKHAL